MRETSADFIEEKNKPENRPVFLYRVEEYDGVNDLLLTSHDQNVTFDGDEYLKFPITHDTLSENSSGEIEQVSVRIGNVTREIQSYIETYDWRGKRVTVTMVFLDQLADVDAKLSNVYYIDNYSADEKVVSVTLNTKLDVLDVQIPRGSYMRNICRWRFKSTECGYAGAESMCNKTKQDCRDNKDNVLRFGAFPSIPQRRLYT